MANEHQYVVEPDRKSSWWRAIFSLAAALLIVALATEAGGIAARLFDQWAGLGTARTFAPGEQGALTTARLSTFLVVFQVTSVVLVLIAARWFGRGAQSPLAFAPPEGGGAAVLKLGAGLIALAAAFTVVVYQIDRNALLNDLLLFRDVLATRLWWAVALTAVVGAPIAEELVFRGLLYGVLRTSPIGAVGAALVTASVWAGVHTQYSVYGMLAIFLIGLYLAWVREKTTSLIGPIFCHAIYNGVILAVLLFAPDNVLEPG